MVVELLKIILCAFEVNRFGYSYNMFMGAREGLLWNQSGGLVVFKDEKLHQTPLVQAIHSLDTTG